MDWDWLTAELDALQKRISSRDERELLLQIKNIVPEFNSGQDLNLKPASISAADRIRLVT